MCPYRPHPLDIWWERELRTKYVTKYIKGGIKVFSLSKKKKRYGRYGHTPHSLCVTRPLYVQYEDTSAWTRCGRCGQAKTLFPLSLISCWSHVSLVLGRDRRHGTYAPPPVFAASGGISPVQRWVSEVYGIHVGAHVGGSGSTKLHQQELTEQRRYGIIESRSASRRLIL